MVYQQGSFEAIGVIDVDLVPLLSRQVGKIMVVRIVAEHRGFDGPQPPHEVLDRGRFPRGAAASDADDDTTLGACSLTQFDAIRQAV